ELRELDATVAVPASRAEPVTARLTAGGKLDAEITAGTAGRAKLVANGLPLAAIAPLLPHLQPGTALDGALSCDITATWGDAEPLSVSTATITLAAGPDELHLRLLEPIPDVRQLSAGKFDAHLTGDLARWLTRTAVFVRVPKHYVFGGTANAHGTLRFTADGMNVDRLTLAIDKARFHGAGLDIDEPRMDAVADLVVNRKTGTAAFENFTINSAPLSVASGRLL